VKKEQMAHTLSYTEHNSIAHMGRHPVVASSPYGHYEWDDDNKEWNWHPSSAQEERPKQVDPYSLQQSQQSGEVGYHAPAEGNFAATVSQIEERCKNTSVIVCSPNGEEGSEAFKAILDTGAAWNFISEQQLRKLGLEDSLQTDKRFIVKTGNGKCTQAEGYVMLNHAELNEDNNTYITNFNPVPPNSWS
jgi:hypothetical protein